MSQIDDLQSQIEHMRQKLESIKSGASSLSKTGSTNKNPATISDLANVSTASPSVSKDTGVDGGITRNVEFLGRQNSSVRLGSMGNHLRIKKRYIFKNEIWLENMHGLRNSKTPKPS